MDPYINGSDYKIYAGAYMDFQRCIGATPKGYLLKTGGHILSSPLPEPSSTAQRMPETRLGNGFLTEVHGKTGAVEENL